jgi:hypothetical protein
MSDVFLEVKAIVKNVIRAGEEKTLTTCPDGYRLDNDGRCAKMTSAERTLLSKRALKAAKSRKGGAAQSAIARQKSLKIRKKKPPTFFKVKEVSA